MPMQDFERRVERRLAIRSRLDKIDKKLLILSGKGGGGKTTVAVHISEALADLGNHVGILDIDLHGPNVAKMTGVQDMHFEGDAKEIQPIEVRPNLLIAGIGSAMKQPEDAIIWRGPMKNMAIESLLASVNWGDLDYLVIDTPPGTGDEQLTIVKNIPELTGAIIVTTAQAVALLDARRSVLFCRKMGIAVLGIVENMSSLECPHCHAEITVFGSRGAQELARELGIGFLGRIPLEESIRSDKHSDNGIGNSPALRAFHTIAQDLARQVTTTTIEGNSSEQ